MCACTHCTPVRCFSCCCCCCCRSHCCRCHADVPMLHIYVLPASAALSFHSHFARAVDGVAVGGAAAACDEDDDVDDDDDDDDGDDNDDVDDDDDDETMMNERVFR